MVSKARWYSDHALFFFAVAAALRSGGWHWESGYGISGSVDTGVGVCFMGYFSPFRWRTRKEIAHVV